MQGDFSRWTFDRAAAYRAVLLQQGRVVLDADWNEQTQITAHHDEVRTRDVVGRAGGPVGAAAFGIVDAAGQSPAAAPWGDLRVTPGRFYVGGVLAGVAPDAAGAGPLLSAQPHLPGAPLPGLPEPAANGRYAVVLEVRSEHVTADEAPRLRESALGGPDTATRAQTIWQLRLTKVADTETCAQAQAEPWLHDEEPTMTASLEDVPADTDPCRITTSSGYRRLENQLYRVEIHDVNGGGPQYLWSRENGSVVAGLVGIDPTSVPGMDNELSLDREGRDEELSIGPSDVVEVTSAGRRLHGLPGFLARTGAPQGQTVPVAWLAGAPASLAALGRAPIVRRWEGEPRDADTTKDPLEDGIEVRFGGAGDFRVGDHWLIPARTVRLAYGQAALSGTIEWPTDAGGTPLPQPPVGPVRHRTVVALLDRTTVGGNARWTLRADCRRLTPPLTELVTIDLLGGDGQEAPPGTPLPVPIRIVVRNGGVPVEKASVRFTTSGGHLTAPGSTPTTAAPATLDRQTDPNGHVDVRWLLNETGAATQTLTATHLDDAGAPVGAVARVTGRLSVASQVAYDPSGCADLAAEGADTVQEAIDTLCARKPGTFPGIHVEEVLAAADRDKLLNDSVVPVARIENGIVVVFDDAIGEGWAQHPVVRVAVDVPWPTDPDDRELWGANLSGWQTITLRGEIETRENAVFWRPQEAATDLLRRLARFSLRLEEPVLARLAVLGNTIKSKDDERWLNGRAFGRLDDGRIDLELPSVDDVHGADFRMWFWLEATREDPPDLPVIAVDPRELVFVRSQEPQVVKVANTGRAPLEFRAQAHTTSPPGRGAYHVDAEGGVVNPGDGALLSVTSAVPLNRFPFAGVLRISSNDPASPTVEVRLETPAGQGVIPLRRGPLRLNRVREEFVRVLTSEEAVASPNLREALGDRPLRLGVAPGFEGAFPSVNQRLAAAGVEVERIDAEPAELVRMAGAGELDGVLGDERLARELEG